MLDVIMLALLAVGFAAAVGYVHACVGATRQASGGNAHGSVPQRNSDVIQTATSATGQQR
jgi:hypothetical protein